MDYTFWIPVEVLKELRALALERETTVETLVVFGAIRYLEVQKMEVVYALDVAC